MKRLLSIALAASLAIGGAMLTAPAASAAASGAWVLESTEYLPAPSYENSTTLFKPQFAQITKVSPSSGDVFTATDTWTAPAARYAAGQTAKLTLSIWVDQYLWNGKNDGYLHMGLNYVSHSVQAKFEDPKVGWGGITAGARTFKDADGRHHFTVSTDNGKIVEAGVRDVSVSAPFPAAAANGTRTSIQVGSGYVGVTRYIYVWQDNATLPKVKAATPTIVGKAKVGKTLTAKAGTWTKGTKFHYQWFADGKKITKATSAKYTITKKMVGKRITVKVTGTKAGYTKVAKMSKPTVKVKKKS